MKVEHYRWSFPDKKMRVWLKDSLGNDYCGLVEIKDEKDCEKFFAVSLTNEGGNK